MKDARLETFETLKHLGFEEKWGFAIWLNDLNPFIERYEISVKDLI